MTIKEQIERAKSCEFLTVDQVALMLQYNRKTIYNWVAQNKIPGVIRLNGRYLRFRRTTVLSWGRQHALADLSDFLN